MASEERQAEMEELVAEGLEEEEAPVVLGRQHHTLIILMRMVTGKQELTQNTIQTLVVLMALTVLMAILEMHIPTAGWMPRKDHSNTLLSTLQG